MRTLTLYPTPANETEHWLEIAYQLGVSEGKIVGRREGFEAAQAQMRDANTYVQEAMGIREELGA